MNVKPTIIYRSIENQNEILEVLHLQEKYHKNQVVETDQIDKGYVTVIHTPELLENMVQKLPQIIAVSDNKIVGYALSMSPDMADWIPVLKPMFNIFELVIFNGKSLSESKYYVMGQICIDEDFRGMGIFRSLYLKHAELFKNRFDLCVTEVAVHNEKSMKAHESVGFKTIHTYTDETDDWNVLIWDWN